jgi:GAF domain-containing protein
MISLAAEAGVAIDNARLAKAAQREIAERRHAEEALRQLNATLEEQVAERTEALRRNEDALAPIAEDGGRRSADRRHCP